MMMIYISYAYARTLTSIKTLNLNVAPLSNELYKTQIQRMVTHRQQTSAYYYYFNMDLICFNSFGSMMAFYAYICAQCGVPCCPPVNSALQRCVSANASIRSKASTSYCIINLICGFVFCFNKKKQQSKRLPLIIIYVNVSTIRMNTFFLATHFELENIFDKQHKLIIHNNWMRWSIWKYIVFIRSHYDLSIIIIVITIEWIAMKLHCAHFAIQSTMMEQWKHFIIIFIACVERLGNNPWNLKTIKRNQLQWINQPMTLWSRSHCRSKLSVNDNNNGDDVELWWIRVSFDTI